MGPNIHLECLLEANPFPDITWYHGTKKVSEGAKYKIKKKDNGKDSYIVTLEIIDPSTEDGGKYHCNAVNEIGESNANIALNFEAGDEDEEIEGAPQFITKPKIIPKEGGTLIVLECKVKSPEKLTLDWSRAGTAIKESNRVKSSIVSEGKEEYVIRMEVRVSYLNTIFSTVDWFNLY